MFIERGERLRLLSYFIGPLTPVPLQIVVQVFLQESGYSLTGKDQQQILYQINYEIINRIYTKYSCPFIKHSWPAVNHTASAFYKSQKPKGLMFDAATY